MRKEDKVLSMKEAYNRFRYQMRTVRVRYHGVVGPAMHPWISFPSENK